MTVKSGATYLALCVLLLVTQVSAQTVLPGVNVTEHTKVEHHGGYVISGDFQVDPKMSAVIFPSWALQEGDILSVQPLKMLDDEYFVLQECASADCTMARILRVWGPFGATTSVHDPNRIIIPHDGKYFLWMKQIKAGPTPAEAIGPHTARNTADPWFTQFEVYGPPLILKPMGALVANSKSQLEEADKTGPMPVKASEREEGSFLATIASGTKVRIKRLKADN
jgi:hypothetical protein